MGGTAISLTFDSHSFFFFLFLFVDWLGSLNCASKAKSRANYGKKRATKGLKERPRHFNCTTRPKIGPTMGQNKLK
jgi:hypothetical protein